MCVARVNGDELPCGKLDGLELHDVWGENGDSVGQKFQQRVLLCNLHHALIEDRYHQAELILGIYRPSMLQEDVQLEILLLGGYWNWVARWELDDTRSGCLLLVGPRVMEYEQKETTE